LHINIYENRKVCTNWVRRILMAEVAYDLIKTFRSANESYSDAHFESLVQWIMKKSVKRSVILNFFKSKVKSNIYIKNKSSSILSKNKAMWLDIAKYRLYNIERINNLYSYSDRYNFNRFIYKNILFKKPYNKRVSKLVNKMVYKYRSFSDYNNIELFSKLNNFRIRSFNKNKAIWDISNPVSYKYWENNWGKKRGKARGHIASYFSNGIFKNRLYNSIVCTEYGIRYRIKFRLNVLKLLLDILYSRRSVYDIYKFIKDAVFLDINSNVNIVILLLHILKKCNISRLYSVINIIKKYNEYDIYYVISSNKYSVYGYVGKAYMHNIKNTIISEYKKIYTKNSNIDWYSKWIYPSSVYSSYDLIKKISNSNKCISSSIRKEHYSIAYETSMTNRFFPQIYKLLKQYKISFIKWYYLYLCREKYMLYGVQDFIKLDLRRRTLVRLLYSLRFGKTLSNKTYWFLVRYMSEGSLIYLHTNNSIKYFNSNISIRTNYKKKYIDNISYGSLRVSNINLKYTSYTKNKIYNLNTVDYGIKFFESYMEYYFIFNELRNNFLIYSTLGDISIINKNCSSSYSNILNSHNNNHNKLDKNLMYLQSNVFDKKSIYFYGNYILLSNLKCNYVNLYSLLCNSSDDILVDDFLKKYLRYNYKIFSTISQGYESYNRLGKLYMNKFYNDLRLNSHFSSIVEKVADIKSFNTLLYNTSTDIESYNYVDGIYDYRHISGELGSYVSRDILSINDKNIFVPSSNLMFYSVWYMMLYLFLYSYQYSSNDHSVLLNWYNFVESMIPLNEKITLSIDNHKQNVYDKLNFYDDILWSDSNLYNMYVENNKYWSDFKKIPIYTKYEEYFFFLSNINYYKKKSFNLKRFKGLNKFYKYGYYGIHSNIYKNYSLLSKSTSYLVIVKKLFMRRLKFQGFNKINSLIYWAEVGESTIETEDNIYKTSFYDSLINKNYLRDNKYLDERNFFYKTYKVTRSIYGEYINYLSEKNNNDINYYKVRNYNREGRGKKNKMRYLYKVENRVKDPRDFFNTYMNLKVINSKSDNNFVSTVIYKLASGYLYKLGGLSDLVLINMVSGTNNIGNTICSNMYFWQDRYLSTEPKKQLVSGHYQLLKSSYSTLYSNEKIYDLYLSSLLDFNNPYYSNINTNIYHDMSNYYKKKADDVSFLNLLRSYIVKNTSSCIKFQAVISNINNKMLNITTGYNHMRYLYLHIINMYYDEIFNNIWYLPMVKSIISYCYNRLIKKYVACYYSFNIKYGIFNKHTHYRYRSVITSFNKITYSKNLFSNSNMILLYNIYSKFHKLHIGSATMLNSWVNYWYNFFMLEKYKSSISYIELNLLMYKFSMTTVGDKKYSIMKIKENKNSIYNNLSKSVMLNKLDSIFDMGYISNKELKFGNSIDSLSYNYIFYKFILTNNRMTNIIYTLLNKSSNSTVILLMLKLYYKFIDRIRYLYLLLRDYLFNNKYIVLNIDLLNFSMNSSLIYSYSFNQIKTNLSINKLLVKSVSRVFQSVNVSRINTIKYSNRRLKRHLISISKIKIRNTKGICRFFIQYYNNILFNGINSKNYHNKESIYSTYFNSSYTNGIRMLNYDFNIIKNSNLYFYYNRSISSNKYIYGNHFSIIKSLDSIGVTDKYISDFNIIRPSYISFLFSEWDYLSMYEPGPISVKLDNLYSWLSTHNIVRIDIRRYYSKFWYRYLPEDVVQIQRYRRFQQEIRRLIANRKCLRSGIIYRRLLLFKLIPGVYKEWHRLHVKRPYIREQFEDRVRFFYILKYKYKISRKRALSSLYNRFSSPYTLYSAYHLLYFRLDNILYKLSFIPSFNYLRDNWSTQFWNISLNNISNISYIQKSLMVGDIFYINSNLHISAVSYRLSFHYENNIYLIYLLWLRLDMRDGLPTYASLPSKQAHIFILRSYIWYWFRYFKNFINLNNRLKIEYLNLNIPFYNFKFRYYGFWAHNFILYKQFKLYMLISSLDHYVRWSSRSMCGFVYREPVGFLNGLHYSSFYRKESGSYGGHLRFTSTFK
jgi:hypothetical protein